MGIKGYRLDILDVLDKNFGWHTLKMMDHLMNKKSVKNHSQAFNEAKVYNEPQVTGILDYELSKAQVTTANFGSHTLELIDNLKVCGVELNNKKAFNKVKDLNEDQARGIKYYCLTIEQVKSKYFNGNTTMRLIDLLVRNNYAPTYKSAYDMLVKGINKDGNSMNFLSKLLSKEPSFQRSVSDKKRPNEENKGSRKSKRQKKKTTKSY